MDSRPSREAIRAAIRKPLPRPTEEPHDEALEGVLRYIQRVYPDACVALVRRLAALPSEPPSDNLDVEALQEAAQALIDFLDGGGFRANHPDDLFSALRAALNTGNNDHAGSGLGSTTRKGLTPAPDASDGLELRDAPSASLRAALGEEPHGQ